MTSFTAVAGPGTEIERPSAVRRERFQGQLMGLGQVLDVDEIADAAAVAGGEVVAADQDGVALAESGLQHERDQVRLAAAGLAVAAVAVGAGGVEVAEDRIAEVIGASVILDQPFGRKLGSAIRHRGNLRRILA